MLVDGKWTEDWQPVQQKDEQGRFIRQVSGFRDWITLDGSAGPTGTCGFKAEAGRYRLCVAYHGLFKVNCKQIADYSRLSAYMERILRLPGVVDTVNLDHITRGNYSIKALNPHGIRPVGPEHIDRLIASALQG